MLRIITYLAYIYVWEIDNLVIKSDILGGFFNFKSILKIIVLLWQLLSILHIQKSKASMHVFSSCRMVPIQKLKTFVAFEWKKSPITLVLSKSKRSNLKVTRKFAKTPRGLHDRGVEYFHETFVRHHSNLTKYIIYIVFLWFMIKTIIFAYFHHKS